VATFRFAQNQRFQQWVCLRDAVCVNPICLFAGTFWRVATLQLVEGPGAHTMQDALPAVVLNSEALSRHAMNDSSANPSSSPAAASANPSTTDEHLMLSFTLGSSDAFTELFHRYKQPIFGFFRRRVSDPSHAEELTQETFFALLRAASRYQPRALFRTYLYAIGFQILRAHRRKAAFRATFLGRPNHIPDPAKHDATESGLWVRRAVDKLEPLDREILLLREFEQLSYSEIADLLPIPLNTVRSRLFRARTALRELLEPASSANVKAVAQPETQITSPSAAPSAAQKGDRS
jgi:RNA polymerase sigma-70 factor (ECF subfamily)